MVRGSRLNGALRPNLVFIGIYSFYDKFRLLVSFVILYYLYLHVFSNSATCLCFVHVRPF